MAVRFNDTGTIEQAVVAVTVYICILKIPSWHLGWCINSLAAVPSGKF